MDYSLLGPTGVKVSKICLGTATFGVAPDAQEAERMVHAAVDLGINFFDTANVYGWRKGGRRGEGVTEQIIGRWFAKGGGRLERTVIATKLYGSMSDWPNDTFLSALNIRKACDASLKRLQTDYIDLYQSHKDDPGTPLEETLGAYAELIEAGKVRAIGASNYGAARLEEALAVSARTGLPRYESLQPEYNLYDRAGYEAELEPLCRDNGLGVICYYSLASGFLTGKYRSEEDFGKSVRGQRMAKYLNEQGRRILAALDEVAARHRATPAQVALAWLLARSPAMLVIPGTSSTAHLEENVAAAELGLSDDDLAVLDG